MIRNIRVDTLKLRTKKYKQNHTSTIAQIKINSKKSFEINIHDTDQYDQYIRTVSINIENIYQKMKEEQTDNPVLVIPQKFDRFLKSKLFKELVKKIL